MANPFVSNAEKQLLQGNFPEAWRVARMGLTLSADDPSLWEIAAHCACQLGDDDGAADCWRRVIDLAPATAYAYSDLGMVLERQGLTVEAEALYRTALELSPDYAAAHCNLGALLADLGREPEAESCYRAALAIDPDFQQARMNLGLLLLIQQRFAEGWPLYEGRLYIHSTPGAPPSSRCTQWRGEPLAGKAILIVPEQGLGDALQFCRYLPWLKAQGAACVTLACWPSQHALLQTLAGADEVVALADLKPQVGTHDYWTFLLSLPLHARTDLSNIPAAVPYLSADPARVAAHAPLLAGDGLRVGVVWRGNPQHPNDGDRSLPGLEVLAPLWSVAGARFFSLQKSDAPLSAVPAGLPLIDLAPAIDDFSDTAALLCQLDLLISVDSAVAHLAGALGVPCWILLPHFKTDWRWLRGRSDSPWYPKTRLFRQPRRGDWETPVAELAMALRQFKKEADRRSQDSVVA
jgi:Flp pilus assembly protein TadD